MAVMVTGGAGYIGSHAVKRLLEDGHRVVSVDNLYRGHREAMDALMPLAAGRLTFVAADVGDRDLMLRLMIEHRVKTVLHFAALAYVGESVQQPLRYYRANSAAALSLIEACDESWAATGGGSAGGVERFVFSSTCASYGEPSREFIPIPETCPQNPINPYGWSKLHTERMLIDYAAETKRQGRPFAVARLRYFNVAGSDRSGLIGEHHEPETHLIPVCLQAALGQRDALTIFGTDYPTPDGTCIRDYVHVEDLVDAHVTVMNALKPGDVRAYNLGIGKGYSNRQIVDAVKRVTGRNFTVKDGPRRPGDPPELYADPRKIKAELGWSARITDLDQIVATAWNWFSKHPRGYGSK
jgi:UDP-glucose-4-epimerase GalE